MEEDFTCPRCNKTIKFLREAIEKKEEDLTCPICLERANPPIFMCPASHLICSTCAPRVQKCPECREELPTPLWRHRYAEKACLDLEDLLQQLVELTGNDPEEEAQRAPGPVLETLSAPQPTFEYVGHTFSNCSLLHKLLITREEERVVSRRGELDRDLLSSTCEWGDISKVTPLHLAARFKSSATVVSTLCEAGANVDALDSSQSSPLHLASIGNPAVVPVLIEAGCKVNLLNKAQRSPLYYAAWFSEDRSAVAALMSAAADPHLGKSPLTDRFVSDEMKVYIRSLSK